MLSNKKYKELILLLIISNHYIILVALTSLATIIYQRRLDTQSHNKTSLYATYITERYKITIRRQTFDMNDYPKIALHETNNVVKFDQSKEMLP